MSKAAVTRLFVGGVVATLAGIILELAALWAALAGGVIVFGGPSVVTVNGGSLAWTLVALVIVGSIAMIGGALAGLVSWIGALLNTVQLEDKTWFVLLLVLGLVSFGFIAMVAYVLAGPDGVPHEVVRPEVAATRA